jgi:hypothetical protein
LHPMWVEYKYSSLCLPVRDRALPYYTILFLEILYIKQSCIAFNNFGSIWFLRHFDCSFSDLPLVHIKPKIFLTLLTSIFHHKSLYS